MSARGIGAKSRRIAFAAVAALFLGGASEAPSATETVRAFVAAFNARDLEAMLALADDAIEWGSLDGRAITVETSGKEALRASLTGYFASCPSCRAELEWVEPAGSRVAAYERSSWTTAAGVAKSQASLSVYELANGRIARVLYFPVER
jgi:hypothetical protein